MRKLWLLAVFGVALSAADVAGTWEGTIEVADTSSGTNINTPVRVVLTRQDGAIGGRIGRAEEEHMEEIHNARLEQNRLTFEVRPTEAGGVVKFDLSLEGDRIEGQMKGALDTGEITGKVHLKRSEKG